jgi:hypothetical protein
MWMFVFSYLGMFSGDMYLIFGLVMLVTLPLWVKGANLYYQSGNTFMGHFYMVFGIMFAGIIAVCYIALYLSHVFPALVMDERVMGIFYLVAGVFLIPTVPSYLYLDKVNLITWSGCTIWLFAGGIFYFYYTSVILYWINVVCCVLVAIGVTYMMVNEAYQMCYGRSLPMGKPLKSWES